MAIRKLVKYDLTHSYNRPDTKKIQLPVPAVSKREAEKMGMYLEYELFLTAMRMHTICQDDIGERHPTMTPLSINTAYMYISNKKPRVTTLNQHNYKYFITKLKFES